MERYGRITAVEQQEKGVRVTVLMSEKVPRVGDSVRIRWGKLRTDSQNRLYWEYLTNMLFECGLDIEAGYATKEELHADLAGHFLAIREESPQGVMRYRIKSTTELDRVEFHEYFEKVDKFLKEFFKIDTAPFWAEYFEFYSQV